MKEFQVLYVSLYTKQMCREIFPDENQARLAASDLKREGYQSVSVQPVFKLGA